MSYRDRSLLDDRATNARIAMDAVAKLDAREFEQTTVARYRGYRAIDPEIIANIVRDHLPALLAAVETLLQDEPDA